jgi:hypothetical protein
MRVIPSRSGVLRLPCYSSRTAHNLASIIAKRLGSGVVLSNYARGQIARHVQRAEDMFARFLAQ